MSIFQNNPPIVQLFPISLGIERHLINAIQQATENDDSDVLIATIVKDAFCLVYPADKVNTQLPALTKVVIKHIEALNAGTDSVSRTKVHTQSLGTQYAQWLSGLDASQACLMLANYDLDKARAWYWYVSTEIISAALKIKAEQISHDVLASMEASLYGFGGKYNDDGGGQGFDLNSSEGLDALKACGF